MWISGRVESTDAFRVSDAEAIELGVGHEVRLVPGAQPSAEDAHWESTQVTGARIALSALPRARMCVGREADLASATHRIGERIRAIQRERATNASEPASVNERPTHPSQPVSIVLEVQRLDPTS